MAVVIIDGRVKVYWLTACAAVAAPTQAELNAGTALQGLITPDGLVINPSTGKVDTSNLASKFTTTRAGRRAFDISITFHHDSVTDTAYLLTPYQANGFIAVRRGTDATIAWAAADKAEVYPVEALEPNQEDPKPDGVWDFMVEFCLTADPSTRAVVV